MNGLRARLSLAAALGVFAVLTVVSGVLFAFFAAGLRAQTDGSLVHAAEQASTIAAAIKRASQEKGVAADFHAPVTVGGADLQIFPGPVHLGDPGSLGPVTGADVAVSEGTGSPYFATISTGGEGYRTYTAPLAGTTSGAIIRVSRAAAADTRTLQRAAALLGSVTLLGTAAAALAGRLTAGRVLRPIAELTAAAEHVTRTRDLAARLRSVSSAGDGARRTAAGDEVGRLATAFDTMMAELQQSIEARRQLVADASHELRTPLTSLTTNLDLLQDGAGVADPQAPRLVDEARTEAHELARLIDDLVDLARFGQGEPHRDDTRLDLLAASAVQRAATRSHAIRFQVHTQPCLVTVDPSAVDRAIANLLDNAAKWSPDGARVRVEVAAGRCSVSDHGPGINPEDLPHLFERFYRSPAARSLPGSGLGLAIVAQVAHSNGGTVTVDSSGPGSTFTLTFPLADPDPGLDPDSGADSEIKRPIHPKAHTRPTGQWLGRNERASRIVTVDELSAVWSPRSPAAERPSTDDPRS